MAQDFDIFLSYNRMDEEVVRQIATYLKDCGLRPWLDENELRPGIPWVEGLENAIRASKAAAVFFGVNGFGDWQRPEIRVLLDCMARDHLPLVPVLLPGKFEKPEIGDFLATLTWVDLRGGITEQELDRLYWGITGEKRADRSRPRLLGLLIHNLPFPPLGELFKGRDEDLKRLEEGLEGGQSTAIVQSEAISGLGGIGKTRLAVEHAWRCGHRYTAAWFIPADSPAALRRGLAALAGPSFLDLPERQALAVDAVLRSLREHPGWLLILDNVDTEEAAVAVSEILPLLTSGRVLVTSRLREWPPTVGKQCLEVIPRQEAVRFLLERTAGERERDSLDVELAGRLAEVLGDLPLALEQAAAHIVHQGMRFSDYLDAWDRERAEVLSWFQPRIMQYPESVAVTWKKTFDRLGPTAGALLRLTAFLAPDPIPAEMFEKGEVFVRESAGLLAVESGRELDSAPIPAALADQVAYSMVTRQDGRRFAVHRMVQEVLRGQIPGERRKDWIARSLEVVNRYSPPGPADTRTWPVWDSLRPHAMAVVAHADQAQISQPTSQLMNQLGNFLYSKNSFAEAEPLMRRALAIDEAVLGTDNPNIAILLNNLAQLLKATNRLSEAEPLMRRALAINEAALGNDHPSVAMLLSRLARLLQATRRLSEAEPLMRRALAINEATFGNDHPNVAADLDTLAQLLQATNRLAEAESLMRRALAIDEASLGTGHPDLSLRLNSLSALLQATARMAEAEPLLRRALAIDEAAFGSDNREVADDLNNLARLLRATNRVAEAETLMRRALAINEASLGNCHPKVAENLNNLAVLLQGMNQLGEAESLLHRAVDILERSLEPDSLNSQVVRKNLGAVLAAIAGPQLGEGEAAAAETR